LVGAELDLRRTATVPLRPDWEYALIVLTGAVAVRGQALPPGRLGYLGEGRDELPLEVREPTRVMLIGGEPFPEPILMRWDLLGRHRHGLAAARASSPRP